MAVKIVRDLFVETSDRRRQTKPKNYHVYTSDGIASVAESAGCSITFHAGMAHIER
jgi:hypothetical protein